MSNSVQVFDTPESIEFFCLAALKARLSLECKGLRGRGQSAYAQAKAKYHLRGNKQAVLAQLEVMVEKAIAKKQLENEINAISATFADPLNEAPGEGPGRIRIQALMDEYDKL